MSEKPRWWRLPVRVLNGFSNMGADLEWSDGEFLRFIEARGEDPDARRTRILRTKNFGRKSLALTHAMCVELGRGDLLEPQPITMRISTHQKFRVEGCARCGEIHPSLTFRRFVTPMRSPGATYEMWAMCPTYKEPILMRTTEEEVTDG